MCLNDLIQTPFSVPDTSPSLSLSYVTFLTSGDPGTRQAQGLPLPCSQPCGPGVRCAQGFAVLRGLLCSGLLATRSGPGQLGAGTGSPFMLSAVPCTLGMETATALLADTSPVSSAV